MPAHWKRLTPTARMTELLMERKREVLAARGCVTVADFEAAWQDAWQVMVTERAFPHATEHRRQWWAALTATKSESRAAFVGGPSAFSVFVERLGMAAEGKVSGGADLGPERLPDVLLSAIRAGYPATSMDERAVWA